MKSSNPVVQAALDARAERKFREVVIGMNMMKISSPIVANAMRNYGLRIVNGQFVMPKYERAERPAVKVENEMTDKEKLARGWKKDKEGDWHKKGWVDDKSGKEERGRAPKEYDDPARQKLTADENKTMDGLMAGLKSQGHDLDAKGAAEYMVSVKDEIMRSVDADDPQMALAQRQIAAAEKYLEATKGGEEGTATDKGEPKTEPAEKAEEKPVEKTEDKAEEGQDGGDDDYSYDPEGETPKTPYEKGDTDFSEQAILNKGVSKEQYDAMSKVAKTEMVVGRDADGNPITKPVSKEFHGMVTAMLCGVDVPDETITSMPEWKEAQAKCSKLEAEVVANGGSRIDDNDENKTIVDTSAINTPERVKLRSDLEKKFMSDTMDETNCEAVELARDKDGKKIPGKYKVIRDEDGNEVELAPYKVKQGRELHLITGLPSAGKSSVFANKLCREIGARLTDCDAIKQNLPEFNNGYGANAVHEESSKINDKVLEMAKAKGDNIVYPLLGKKAEKLLKIKEDAERQGYTVVLHYNDLNPAKAKGRLINRFLSQGRFMQPALVSKPGYSCRQAFEEVKDNFDVVEAASNDVGKGEKPRMLFKKP